MFRSLLHRLRRLFTCSPSSSSFHSASKNSPYGPKSKYYRQSYFDTQISIPEWETREGRGRAAYDRWNGNRFDSVSVFDDESEFGKNSGSVGVSEVSGVWESRLTLNLGSEREREEWWGERRDGEMSEVAKEGKQREAWWNEGARR
jgi:hypothetical protein